MLLESEIASQPHDHQVLFYEDDDQLTTALSSYVTDALQTGGVAVVIATADHRWWLEAKLAGQGIDAAAARAAGSLATLDAAETLSKFLVGGRPDPERFDASVGDLVRHFAATGRMVAAYGEMVALLWDQGAVAEAMELEELWNDLRHNTGFGLLCAYSASSVADEVLTPSLERICRLHSGVVGPRSSYVSVLDGSSVASERSCDLPAHDEALRKGRSFARNALRDWGHTHITDDAVIVLNELMTNAIIHARSASSVTLSVSRDGLRISVDDRSEALPSICAPPVAEPTGRGLAVVAGLSRRWGFELRGPGKVVWAELAL